jgi:hypothetical protein
MIIANVRLDWCFVFKTNQKGKYGVTLMLPKGSAQETLVKDAIEKAKADGVAKNMFTMAQTKGTTFKGCIHDGDAEFESGDRPAHYKGHSYINCTNKEQPGVLGPNGQRILDSSPFFSGWYVTADVAIRPFNNESRGVGAYIHNLMFVKEGDRLDGRVSAENAFADFITSDPEQGAENMQ